MPDPAADISAFTGVFRAHLTGENRRVTKRNRQPISCAPCRARKAKCDRQQPCGACTRRSDGESCEYGANATVPSTKSKDSAKIEAQARLKKLEDMVQQMIQAGTKGLAQPQDSSPANQAPEPSNHAELYDKIENLSVQNEPLAPRTPSRYLLSSHDTEHSFVGPTHWTAIVDSLHEIRDSLNETGGQPDPPSQPIVYDVYFGPLAHLSIEEVLAALPPRTVVDNILLVYFTSKFFLTPFVHVHNFQRHYNAFWKNPTAASFMWVSSLFSALCIGITLATRAGRAASLGLDGFSPRVFQEKAGQCIVSGQYMRTQPYAIEALLLYTHSKYLQCVDSDATLWALVSLIVRLAQKQGMHREPEKLPGKIKPFDAEIRRRLWFYIETFDILLSFQLGMPPIIHENECDISPPSNLGDDDFDEDTAVLPPERPHNIYTPMLFYTYKARSLRIFRRTVRLAFAVVPPPYEETLKLDRELKDLYVAIPKHYKAKPIRGTAFTDGIHEIMHRLMLEMIHLKSMCILHRPYLSQEKNNPKYDYSREAAAFAAMMILERQAEFYYESRSGGRLYEDKWILTSLTMHDFLLAAMVLGVALLEVDNLSQHDRNKRLNALYTSYNIWSERRTQSRDAAHASRVLASILSKLSSRNAPPTASAAAAAAAAGAAAAGPSSSSSTNIGAATAGQSADAMPDLSSVNSTVSTGVSNEKPVEWAGEGYRVGWPALGLGETPGDLGVGFEGMDLDGLDELLADMDNIDWNNLDSYVRDTEMLPKDWPLDSA